MAIYIRRGLNSPTNNCIKQTTPPEDLLKGPACERELSGNTPYDFSSDGYSDGYIAHCIEGSCPTPQLTSSAENCPPGAEIQGYHRTTPNELFTGQSTSGRCISPYYRLANPREGGLNATMRNREEQLLATTGKSVQLIRRQYTGVQCPCNSSARGRSRKKCHICFGTSFVPGYIPYIYDKDPLGRILVRFEPYSEKTTQKEQGRFQEIQINAWTLSFPEIRKRDVLIVYNSDDGTEEFRYEVLDVTRGVAFGGAPGAQKFTIVRIDPTDIIYSFDPLAIPDLADIQIDVSAAGTLQGARIHEGLGTESGGLFEEYTEDRFGDAAFSGLFTEGYKMGYEVNFMRALNFEQPMYAPDFNEDGTIDEGYGPIFVSTNGKIIKFATPQQIPENTDINVLEVLVAEKKKYFIEGWIAGSRDGTLDGVNELRARGLLT